MICVDMTKVGFALAYLIFVLVCVKLAQWILEELRRGQERRD